MTGDTERLRVALIAGSLVQGGAEKQLVYMASALLDTGVDVKVYSLTKGEYYEPTLVAMGLRPIWFGKYPSPPLRVTDLARTLRPHNPHILQSAHFFSSLYVAIAARLSGSISIGSIRNDTFHELKANRTWGKWLLRSPSALIANSHTAKRNAVSVGIKSDKIHILSNVIDLVEFDKQGKAAELPACTKNRICAFAIARLVHAKRLDRFLRAIALSRREIEDLTGIIVGDGPERSNLEAMAADLGLLPDGVMFLGKRNDVPALLRRTDLFVLTSDHEGCPNVILEAMAAGVPVVTTPAGDADVLVQEGATGYVVPFNDVERLAERIIHLARSPELRKRLGEAGRREVKRGFDLDGLAEHLMAIYHMVANRQGNYRLQRVLE